MKISGIIIAKNEEKTIEKALISLKEVCDEVVLVDSGSTDKTTNIAKNLEVKVIYHKWEGYKEQRNYAQKIVAHDWIIMIDADEELSNKLKKEIIEIKKQNDLKKFVCYKIPRNYIFLKKKFDSTKFTCEWKNRFYNRNYCYWVGGSVHEKLFVKGKIKKLSGFINHNILLSIEELMEKLNKYAKLYVKSKYKNKKNPGIFLLFLKTIYYFLKYFFLELRIFHGIEGFILAWVYLNYSISKHIINYDKKNHNQ